MTRDEYGNAYKKGYERTVQFLVSRGLSPDSANETAQAAWARGWERLGQLRDSKMVMTWMNTIAINLFRNSLRRKPLLEMLPDVLDSPTIDLAAIDVQGILKTCKENDRLVLERHYLEGYTAREIASAHGWSETAVRIRLLRARRAVAKTLAA
jgi:RNA polymerase sigma factor (sigma-70 family)